MASILAMARAYRGEIRNALLPLCFRHPGGSTGAPKMPKPQGPDAANREAGLAEYVHKLRAVAWVSEQGEEEVEGYFALAPQAQFHPGPETLLEKLNSSDRVIPFHLRENDGVVLLNRLEIERVFPSKSLPPELLCPQTYQV